MLSDTLRGGVVVKQRKIDPSAKECEGDEIDTGVLCHMSRHASLFYVFPRVDRSVTDSTRCWMAATL